MTIAQIKAYQIYLHKFNKTNKKPSIIETVASAFFSYWK